VRVDILERLADLIRPPCRGAKARRSPKPDGAFDGRSFTVTQAMTSLTGSAGEDFASILRALGYRMEKRPPLPPTPVPAGETVAPASEIVAAESAGDAAAEPARPIAANDNFVETPPATETADAVPAEASADMALVTPMESLASEPTVTSEPEATADVAIVGADDAATAEAATTGSSGDMALVAPMESPSDQPATPELVEVWRPGGRSEERRPPHDNRKRHHRAPRHGAPGEGEQAPADGQPRGERQGHGRRERWKNFRKPQTGTSDAASGSETSPDAAAAQQHEPRKDQGRPGKRFHGKAGNGQHGHGQQGQGGRGRPDQRSDHQRDNRPQRDRPIDPNSPFAKLAALKEQLEKR
jgi:ATP-dependent RNA helicase SUPV3L1/SUV3